MRTTLYHLGLIALGAVLWSGIKTTLVDDWKLWRHQREVQGLEPSVLPYAAHRTLEIAQDLQIWLHLEPPRVAPLVIDAVNAPALRVNTVLGRLDVPRLGIQAPVREGDGDETLAWSLGHTPGTAMPGMRGNVVVAGRRDTFFRRLAAIRQNDVLQFETPDGSFTYQVVSTSIAKSDVMKASRRGRTPEITLVASGDSPEAFVVIARQLSRMDPVEVSHPAIVPVPPKPEEASGLAEEAKRRVVSFALGTGRSRRLTPGAVVGVSESDPTASRVTAWVSLGSNGRTLWFNRQPLGEPITFADASDRYQVTFSHLANGTVTATALLP